jgi:tetratricopeptide (TPR) repeat protein
MAPEDLPLALERHLTARGEPFLWIVDDLPGGLEADALASWLAPGRLGHTLITTRSRGYDGVGAQLDLGAMDADDGFELLTRRRPPSGDEERRAARGLVDDLGRHALAIDVAGAALAAYAGVHTYAQYRAALTDPSRDELEIAAKLADELPGGHERSIAMTLARSISKLGQPGRDFLRLASRLATDPIPALLAVETIARVDRLDPRDARARAVAGMKEAGLHSLAEVIGVDEARQVHTLVSRTVRGLEKPAPRIDALAAATVTVLTRQLRASIEQRSDAEPPVLAHARHVSAPTRTQGQAALAIAVAWHDYRRGDFRGAAALELRALQTYRKLYGDRHPDTLTARDTLGETLRSLGDLAGARSHLDRAAAVLPGVLGSRHPRTLSAFNNLGLTLMQQGNLAKARTLLQRAVSGRLALLGETHPDTLASENNLAVVLGLQGDIPAARILHEHALLVRQELLGNYHPDTLVSLNNLAMMSREQGELDAAHALSVQALEGRRRILGDEHPETLVSLHNLAATLIAQGAHAQARDLLDQLVDARRRVLGPGHPDTHAAEHLLGAIS